MAKEDTNPSKEVQPEQKISRARTNEDTILIEALQRDRGDEVWQAMYRVYREPFIAFFQKGLSWELKKINDLLDEVFNTFIQEVIENGNQLVGKVIIFRQLLVMGCHFSKAEWKGAKSLVRSLEETGIHYESDILLILMKISNEWVKDKVSKLLLISGKRIFLSNLERGQLGFEVTKEDKKKLSPSKLEEISLISLEAFYKNVVKGTIAPPMRATLETYHASVFKNTVRNWLRSPSKKIQPFKEWMPGMDLQSGAVESDELKGSPIERESRNEIRRILDDEHFKVIERKYQPKSTGDLVESLMNELSEKCQIILKNFFLNQRDYKQIVELIETITGEKTTVGAVKKMSYDCKRRLLRKLQLRKKDKKKPKKEDGNEKDKNEQINDEEADEKKD